MQVAIQPKHRLITSGSYRWIRHPCYTGTLITVFGIPMAIGMWALAPIVGVLFLVGHSYRINVEEAVLVEEFGQEYEAYRSRTWRVFPGW